ncbi:hypothetical protein LX15_001308 [Streptoalloteichus tenebrarius]|uniref:Uncharacterized protein n=1 Tax=Streptoalloteichus tenebrarius (strain ATCC 17920 / DSM 40477 / JCM 4838 / CBS 697.72 / NBRC 16177 / NCIMB 11028 / NRRL B-12390 / A12253. 1 / ISP 5477) TaxID=1933 RepID=A0ABT1HQ49_STRSD|nr:hypothetical protein [Streptoalloteichus tenebrarius]MCP2257623.1 hypothetical protein [Streptoalloteichus tenebrarius]
MSRATFDGLQGLCGLVAVTLGVIPLVRWLISAQHGALFRWVFGEQTGVLGYLLPMLVVAVMIGAIAALEKAKNRA